MFLDTDSLCPVAEEVGNPKTEVGANVHVSQFL